MASLPAFDWDIDLALGIDEGTADPEPERDEPERDEPEQPEESDEGYDESLRGSASELP